MCVCVRVCVCVCPSEMAYMWPGQFTLLMLHYNNIYKQMMTAGWHPRLK